MDYAFNHRDLRGEEDVSGLEFDLLFWRRVHLQNNVRKRYYMSLETDQSSVCGRGVRLRAGGDLE